MNNVESIGFGSSVILDLYEIIFYMTSTLISIWGSKKKKKTSLKNVIDDRLGQFI